LYGAGHGRRGVVVTVTVGTGLRFESYLVELHDLVGPELFITGGGIVGAALVADSVVPA
jgi:hypothetical protein